METVINGKQVNRNEQGYLTDFSQWDESVAETIALEEGIALTERHWDVINYLRDEYVNNGANQPNTRSLVKAMSRAWDDRSVNAKTLYDLFPGDPSKQGGRIAGLPESRRKGGY